MPATNSVSPTGRISGGPSARYIEWHSRKTVATTLCPLPGPPPLAGPASGGGPGRGHNVVATVFLECHSMYRADGPPEMRPVGETEFVAGIAAMSASGNYGSTRVAAGVVGHADLT